MKPYMFIGVVKDVVFVCLALVAFRWLRDEERIETEGPVS